MASKRSSKQPMAAEVTETAAADAQDDLGSEDPQTPPPFDFPPELISRIVDFVAPPCKFEGSRQRGRLDNWVCSCHRIRRRLLPLLTVNKAWLAEVSSRLYAHFACLPEAFATWHRIESWFSALDAPAERGAIYASSIRAIELSVGAADAAVESAASRPRAVGPIPDIVRRLRLYVPRMSNLRRLDVDFDAEAFDRAPEALRDLLVAMKKCPLTYLALGLAPAGEEFQSCLKSWKRLETLLLFELHGAGGTFPLGFSQAIANAPASILDLRLDSRLGFKSIIKLLGRSKSLENLALGGLPSELPVDFCQAISARSETLKGLGLSFAEPTTYSSQLATMLDECQGLERLLFDSLELDRAGIDSFSEMLAKQTRLKDLSLHAITLDDPVRAYLKLPGQLKNLVLGGCLLEGHFADLLKQTPHLTSLEIHYDALRSRDWLAISKLTELEYLDVRDLVVMRTWQLQDIAQSYLPKLDSLVLGGSPERRGLVEWVSEMKELRPKLEIEFPDAATWNVVAESGNGIGDGAVGGSSGDGPSASTAAPEPQDEIASGDPANPATDAFIHDDDDIEIEEYDDLELGPGGGEGEDNEDDERRSENEFIAELEKIGAQTCLQTARMSGVPGGERPGEGLEDLDDEDDLEDLEDEDDVE